MDEQRKGVVDDDIRKMLEMFYGMVKSLNEFDMADIQPVVKGQPNMNDREKCVLGLYYRVGGNVVSLLKLNQVKDFQAVIVISRVVLELAVDVKLIVEDLVEKGVEKAFAFHDVERLRSARTAIELEKTYPEADASPQKKWVAENEQSVEARHEHLWGRDGKGRLKKIGHWSGLDFATRTRRAGSEFDRWNKESYAFSSWHVHSGLVGFVNLQANTFAVAQARAFSLIANCYREVLSLVIREFKLARGDEKINDKLKLAYMIPGTESREQAAQLMKELGLK